MTHGAPLSWAWMRSRGFLAVAILAVICRLALATVNRYANDDHVEVAERILASGGRELIVDDCWECYHPKLYHKTVAALIQAIPPETRSGRILIGQYVSAAAGIGALVPVALLLASLPAAAMLRTTVFALVALNPRLIAISSQATNDSLVIFFAALGFYLLASYLLGRGRSRLVIALALAEATIFTKGSGIFVCLAFAATIAGTLILGRGDRKRRIFEVGALAALAGVVTLSLAFGSPYRQHRVLKGSPFATNDSHPSPRRWIGPAGFEEPGILDVYATFRYLDLLKEPSLMVDVGRRSVSLWTHLYGRALHSRFDRWPPQWRPESRWPSIVGRAELGLGLLPLFLLLTGVVMATMDAAAPIVRRQESLSPLSLSSAMGVFALFGMMIPFTWGGPHHSFTKFIYVLPALVPMTFALLTALEGASQACKPVVFRLTIGALWIQCGLSVVDVALLTLQLGA